MDVVSQQAGRREASSNKAERWMSRFVLSAGCILSITALAKIISAFGTAKILGLTDPFLGITFNWLLLSAGILELVVATVCFLRVRQIMQLFLIAWMSTGFLVYRVGLWASGWHSPCSCLGTMTDALGIPPGIVDGVMKGLLAYLLVGSYLGLISGFRNKAGVPA